jgi:hypothetical protein
LITPFSLIPMWIANGISDKCQPGRNAKSPILDFTFPFFRRGPSSAGSQMPTETGLSERTYNGKSCPGAHRFTLNNLYPIIIIST